MNYIMIRERGTCTYIYQNGDLEEENLSTYFNFEVPKSGTLPYFPVRWLDLSGPESIEAA